MKSAPTAQDSWFPISKNEGMLIPQARSNIGLRFCLEM
jgi:hypothetical protein